MDSKEPPVITIKLSMKEIIDLDKDLQRVYKGKILSKATTEFYNIIHGTAKGKLIHEEDKVKPKKEYVPQVGWNPGEVYRMGQQQAEEWFTQAATITTNTTEL